MIVRQGLRKDDKVRATNRVSASSPVKAPFHDTKEVMLRAKLLTKKTLKDLIS
jgi:hypothetical protein